MTHKLQQKMSQYDVTWTSQCKDASESMPLGGGDVGLNVWTKNDNIYFYIARSGCFDENNSLLKLGRIKLSLKPNIINKFPYFKQKLDIYNGTITISANDSHDEDKAPLEIRIWTEIKKPVIHMEIHAKELLKYTIQYESWRIDEKELLDEDSGRFGSFGWTNYPGKVYRRPDIIMPEEKEIAWYHKNDSENTIFDVTVNQQDLDGYKDRMNNPLKNLIFGGKILAPDLYYAGKHQENENGTDFHSYEYECTKGKLTHHIIIGTHLQQTPDIDEWKNNLNELLSYYNSNPKNIELAQRETKIWWNDFWNRSYIFISPSEKFLDKILGKSNVPWNLGRNYQLFRHMLACNAYGEHPSKFNGGIFTFDPVLVASKHKHDPDWRQWGGGCLTIQNQRLLYWPMLKSGDFDMIINHFEFYRKNLINATLRVTEYWGHQGCLFTESIENFGLPNAYCWGWKESKIEKSKRTSETEKGIQQNPYIKYHYEGQLEFAYMILQYHQYSGIEIKQYMEFIEQSVLFFFEHYRYRLKKESGKELDENGKIVIYPSTSLETYKDAKNPVEIIAGLHAIIDHLIIFEKNKNRNNNEKLKQWETLKEQIPEYTYSEIKETKIIHPAEKWSNIINIELPQFYPLFPFDQFSYNSPEMKTFQNTWKLEKWSRGQKSHVSWHQNGIFLARMKMTKEAWKYCVKKMNDSKRRYPTFWGPGHDWVPDHNWGGSGMINLQEMLMQTFEKEIYLFPAWPSHIDVEFKLRAPFETIVHAKLERGHPNIIEVIPREREKDIKICLQT